MSGQPNDVSDPELVTCQADPGPDARDLVSALFATHYLGLVRLAIHLVDDQETAEDVVQDVFDRFSRIAHTRVPEAPLSYLRTAVVNQSYSVLRRRRVFRIVFARRPDLATLVDVPADTRVLEDERRTRMLAAVRKLPPRQREIVVLRYYETLEIQEIAQTLSISSSAVSSSLGRALAALTKNLESWDKND